jgi:Protein of unknown function (DUF3102)
VKPTMHLVHSQDPTNADPILREHADNIRVLHKRTFEQVVEIGRLLTECKKIVGHGYWLWWLESEFGWAERTARSFMSVFNRFKSADFADLDLSVSVLYRLAAPSTPDEACDEVIARTKAGETVPLAEVEKIITKSKATAEPIAEPAVESHDDDVRDHGQHDDPDTVASDHDGDDGDHHDDPDDEDVDPALGRLIARAFELDDENQRLKLDKIALTSEIDELKVEAKSLKAEAKSLKAEVKSLKAALALAKSESTTAGEDIPPFLDRTLTTKH